MEWYEGDCWCVSVLNYFAEEKENFSNFIIKVTGFDEDIVKRIMFKRRCRYVNYQYFYCVYIMLDCKFIIKKIVKCVLILGFIFNAMLFCKMF